MHRLFVERPLRVGESLQLPEEAFRHASVLRLRVGETLRLFNGQGGEYTAEITQFDRKNGTARIDAFLPREAELPYTITLAQGIAGGEKMDWLVEKAVESGVSKIVPLSTARSVVRLDPVRAERRRLHWQALVQAACEQCGRNRLPEIAAVRNFGAWLEEMTGASGVQGAPGASHSNANELRLTLSPRAQKTINDLPVTAPAGEVIVLIGPEGGLSEDEELLATQYGFTALSVGPRILRTETAGIAILSVLAARWGGW
ncbi:MAG: 16S rRNA (uracil(1498)-N(3))-methyltransferase [Janthinobacterium lividum]